MLNVVGNRRFRPSLFAIVLAVGGIAGCFRLGVWQLDRAAEKRTMLAAFASDSMRTLTDSESRKFDELPRYQPIELTGRYDPQRQVLLDNMPSSRGQPGYQVLTALQRENGEWLLVDRGWVPAGATRAQLPDISVDDRMRTVRGRLDELPRPGIRLGASGSAQAGLAQGWPRVLNFPQHAELVAALGRPLASRMLLLDAAQRDGYEREWQARFSFGPERHLAYAVQWFAMLLAIAITFLVVSFKKGAGSNVG